MPTPQPPPPPPPESLRAVVEALVRAFERMFDWEPPVKAVVLQFEGGGELRLSVPGRPQAQGLTPTQAAIVAVLRAAPAPLKSITVAAKARAVPNKHFLAALLQLQRL